MSGSRSMRASFILELQDRVSGGLGGVMRQFDRLREMARRMSAVQIGGALLAGAGFLAATRGAADLEQRFRDMAIAAGATGPAVSEMVRTTQGEVERLALLTRTSSEQLLGGLNTMVARGLDLDEARRMLPVLARMAAASGAQAEHLANLAVTARVSSGVRSADDMERAFGMALRAGQMGGFELRDMARYLPGILAQAKELGVTGADGIGRVAAQLQVMRDAFGSVEEAGAGAMQLWAHLSAKDTQKHFQEMGINLRGVIQTAMRDGIDPFEAIMQQVRRVTRGRPFAATDLMPDQNARQAMLGFLGGVQRYLDMRREMRGLPPGFVQRNADDRNGGAGGDQRAFDERAKQIANRMGAAWASNLGWINASTTAVMGFVGVIDQRFPGAVDAVLGFAGGAAAIGGVLAALGVAFPAVALGARLLLMPLLMVTGAIGSLVGLSAGAVLGISALATGFVMAGLHIYKHWGRFEGFFQSMWDGVKAIFSGFGEWLVGFFTGDSERAVRGVMTMWNGLGAYFGGLWGVVKTLFLDFAAWVDGWTGGAATQAMEAIGSLWAGLLPILQRVWDGLKDSFGQLGTWLAAEARRIWGEVQIAFSEFTAWVGSWIDGAMQAVIDRFKAPWEGLKAFFTGLFGEIGRIFGAVWAPIDAAIERARVAMPQSEAAVRANAAAAENRPARANANPGAVLARQALEVNGRIVVEGTPGTTVREAESTTPGITLAPANSGSMLGRP